MAAASSNDQQLDTSVAALDPIWDAVRIEATAAAEQEPVLGGFVFGTILSSDTLDAAIIQRVAQRLDHRDVEAGAIQQVFRELLADHPSIGRAFRADMAAVFDRDPACSRYIEPLLYFKGFHALVTHRFAHVLWHAGRRDFALYLQSQASRIYSVDIHPAAQVGIGIMLDHAHSLVFGETCRIGDNVSILHGVTLGGTGKVGGDRHPTIGDNVLIGAGAKVLGNIVIGTCSRIAAGSVVLKDVPSCKTVAGIPAVVIGDAGCPEPARSMEHRF
ncbi:MAG: serine O-acetyltransferase [Hyphomicrobiaceae bacterium]|jgi:serine O-acetyltransferase